MEIVSNNYMPGDPRLIDHIMYELKSKGIFDNFRKECIADVDTKPAYQNLRQRVEGSVSGFLKTQRWRPDMNKNHVREMLRKNISESGFLETGVERIVDQVVNPKINSIFLPRVEDVVYRYLGIQKPSAFDELKAESSFKGCARSERMDINLLPSDLEAVSPESEPPERKVDISSDSLKLDDCKMDDDESPPFEPLEESNCMTTHEENSVDSHLSGFSGLASHDSNHSFDVTNKIMPMEISNQDTQMSKQSSDDHLSIVMSDDTENKIEINEDSSQSKVLKTTDTSFRHFDFTQDNQTDNDKSVPNTVKQDKYDSSKKHDEKPNKSSEKKTDGKHRCSDKHKSRHDSRSENKDHKSEKDRKSDHDRKEHKDRSKHGSRDGKDRDKEKRDNKSKSGKDEKDGESKSEKDHKHDREKDKNKSSSNSRHSSSSSKDKNKKDSNDSKPKEKKDSSEQKDLKTKEPDKTVKSKELSSSSSLSLHKDYKTKEKTDSSKSRDDSKSRSESKSHSSGKRSSDSKSHSKHNGRGDAEKSSSKSSKKDEKSSKKEDKHHSRSETHTSSKRDEKHDKDKKDSRKDEKKGNKDDHYGLKGKNSNRRSTDRDSSDGHSGTQSSSSSFADSSTSSHVQKSSQDTSRINSRSNSGDSGSSDKAADTITLTETSLPSSISTSESQNEDTTQSTTIQQLPPVKLIKPKFASNIYEAKRLMKIRKKLGKIEKQSQMGLINAGITLNNSLPSVASATTESQVDSVVTYEVLPVPEEEPDENIRRRPNILKKSSKLNSFPTKKTRLLNHMLEDHAVETTVNEMMNVVREEVIAEVVEVNDDLVVSPLQLQTSVVSKESWDAVEAKHLESIDYNSYVDTGSDHADTIEDIDVTLNAKSGELKSDDCLYLTTDTKEVQKYFDVVNTLINYLNESITNKEDLLKHSSNIDKNKGKLNMKRDGDKTARRLPKVAVVDVTSDNEVTITPNKITKYASENHPGHHNNNNKRSHQLIEDELDEQINHSAVEINNPNKLSAPMKTKKLKTADSTANHVDSFNLPLSPAESEKSFTATSDNKKGDKDDLKVKRSSNSNKAANNTCNQRYSTDDLYKPRLQFSSSRRRAAKNQDLN